MFVELDLQSEVPIYTQLVEQIIEGIARGQLKPGDPLPSVRSLAADLGINLHTVNKAYQIMKQEGFLQIHRKQGVVVQSGGMPGVTAEFEAKLERQLKALAAEGVVRGMQEETFVRSCLDVFRQLQGNSGKEDS
ncbi:DNA-binding transcriptional regulator YhcF, GntR family [Paenibacillus sp. UNCCL117]|uniref:GntR family transcriptional regulator n=1 Tax=unclassified Paenibacillus TaxID=185978 RepID=UPI0008851DC0|nr:MULTISPECIES: GntR family transcriptional regulator [unclassified Paenibacillus]SDE27237.1 DNA-binding transcriptional regulator YhcF, GntR family [Paenibacillus sp. cl123]SFW62787.1 DNA-binding transcriptional regulator YhcF, GntR family [Paenibacillus sp. UNCCL117]